MRDSDSRAEKCQKRRKTSPTPPTPPVIAFLENLEQRLQDCSDCNEKHGVFAQEITEWTEGDIRSSLTLDPYCLTVVVGKYISEADCYDKLTNPLQNPYLLMAVPLSVIFRDSPQQINILSVDYKRNGEGLSFVTCFQRFCDLGLLNQEGCFEKCKPLIDALYQWILNSDNPRNQKIGIIFHLASGYLCVDPDFNPKSETVSDSIREKAYELFNQLPRLKFTRDDLESLRQRMEMIQQPFCLQYLVPHISKCDGLYFLFNTIIPNLNGGAIWRFRNWRTTDECSQYPSQSERLKYDSYADLDYAETDDDEDNYFSLTMSPQPFKTDPDLLLEYVNYMNGGIRELSLMELEKFSQFDVTWIKKIFEISKHQFDAAEYNGGCITPVIASIIITAIKESEKNPDSIIIEIVREHEKLFKDVGVICEIVKEGSCSGDDYISKALRFINVGHTGNEPVSSIMLRVVSALFSDKYKYQDKPTSKYGFNEGTIILDMRMKNSELVHSIKDLIKKENRLLDNIVNFLIQSDFVLVAKEIIAIREALNENIDIYTLEIKEFHRTLAEATSDHGSESSAYDPNGSHASSEPKSSAESAVANLPSTPIGEKVTAGPTLFNSLNTQGPSIAMAGGASSTVFSRDRMTSCAFDQDTRTLRAFGYLKSAWKYRHQLHRNDDRSISITEEFSDLLKALVLHALGKISPYLLGPSELDCNIQHYLPNILTYEYDQLLAMIEAIANSNAQLLRDETTCHSGRHA